MEYTYTSVTRGNPPAATGRLKSFLGIFSWFTLKNTCSYYAAYIFTSGHAILEPGMGQSSSRQEDISIRVRNLIGLEHFLLKVAICCPNTIVSPPPALLSTEFFLSGFGSREITLQRNAAMWQWQSGPLPWCREVIFPKFQNVSWKLDIRMKI